MPTDANLAERWCFSWIEPAPSSPGADRLAALTQNMWSAGDTLTVSFLDGDKRVKDRVEAAARQWTGPNMANLRLVFQKKTSTLIRISFKGRGSWSVLGNSCRQIDKARPTMNLGWLTPSTPDDEVNRVVLHEFGHALGLVHEHQNPAGTIAWDRARVAASLAGAPNFWPLDRIEKNLFEPYARKETNFSRFDPDSIMIYPIPAHWTTDGFSVSANSKLSATDIAFIRKLYPWQ